MIDGVTGFLTSGTLSVAGYGAGKLSTRKTVAALAPDDPKIKGSGILAKYQRDIISLDNLKAAYAEAEAYGSTPEQLARIEEKIQKQEAALEAQESSTELTRVLEADGLGEKPDKLAAESGNDWAELSSDLQKSIIKWETGFSNFKKGENLREYVMNIPPKSGFFDVAMHGEPEKVGFGTARGEPVNMTARQLAAVIKHMEHYRGQKIRLLSCSTGKQRQDDYCVAEELANALGVEVEAPTDTLYVWRNGTMRVGHDGKGTMRVFKPNERRRIR